MPHCRRHLLGVFLAAAAIYSMLDASAAQSQGGTRPYRIIVIAGEDAINVIQQKTATAPIIEVRDRNDLPVGGIPVTFTLAEKTAVFSNATQTVTVMTDAAGRAVATGLTPLTNGSVRITVTATVQGQQLSAGISQTNVSAAPPPSTSGGGGLSSQAIGLIAAGAGGGAAVAAALGGADGSPPTSPNAPQTTSSSSPVATPGPGTPVPQPTNRPPIITSLNASRSRAIVGIEVVFSAPATDADGDPLTHSWDFGDGSTSTLASPTHIFQRAGVFMVRVTVRDREAAAEAEAPVGIGSLSGVWNHPGTTTFRMTLTQNGTTLNGSFRYTGSDSQGRLLEWECAAAGTVRPSTPHLQLFVPACRAGTGPDIPAADVVGEIVDVDTIVGRVRSVPANWKRQ